MAKTAAKEIDLSSDEPEISVSIPEEYAIDPAIPVVPMEHIARVFASKHELTPIAKFTKQRFGQFAWVPAKKCFINFEEQRFPEDKHILKLNKNYDTELCTPLIAVYYPDTDTYHVSDGQQHGIATLLQYLDFDDEELELPVWFVTGDASTERKLVLGLNRDNLPMARFFIHQAEVKNGIDTAVKIQRMCDRIGVVPAYKAKGKLPCITHITNLYISFKSLGEKNTEKALQVLKNAFPTKTNGVSVQHINTLAMLGLAGVFKQLKAAQTYTDELAEDIGLVLSIAFKDMNAVHKDIKFWFEQLPKSQKLEVENIGRYSSGILKTYEAVTGYRPVDPIYDSVKPVIMLTNAQRRYAKEGGLHA